MFLFYMLMRTVSMQVTISIAYRQCHVVALYTIFLIVQKY